MALRATSVVPYDLHDTVLVAGTPRSGTTWLGQLFSAIPRSAIMFEPLRGPEARAAGVSWATVEGASVDDPRAIAFIRAALRGKVRTRWTMRENSVAAVAGARTWIVKEVRINRVLPWIVRHFALERAVVLVRDPSAVVASQLNFAPKDPIAEWLDVPRTRPPTTLVARYPWLGAVEVQESDAVAQLALQWALDQLVALSDPAPAWTVVGYEALRRAPLREMEMIFDRWAMPVPAGLSERVAVPSSVTRSGAKDLLTARDRSTIEDVCRAVGLDLVADPDAPCMVRVRPDLGRANELT